jgi:hypothetical protein
MAAARMARWSRYLLARPSLNPHANRCISTDRTVSTREIHILLHAQYLASTPPRLVLSLQTIFPRRAMHQGCVAGASEGGRGAAGWWPTSRSCRWAGRPTTPASWPPTTRRTCPATVSPQAAGTAPAPLAWGCRAKHRWRGSRPCSKAATPPPASSLAALTAATPSPPSTWSCGRPRASRSSTASGMRPPAGRCWPPITPGWPKRSHI